MKQYYPIAKKYKVPIVVTGFEPLDILQGILMTVKQLESGKAEVENQYSRVVQEEGNIKAKEVISEVFKVQDQYWRGIDIIPNSGWGVKDSFQAFNAEKKFPLEDVKAEENEECIAGAIMKGIKKPRDCKHFGKKCTPENPLGAPMVSSEGACAAYYNYATM